MQPADEFQRMVRLAPHLRCEAFAADETVVLVGEREHYLMRGPSAIVLTALATTAPRSVADVLDVCAPKMPPEYALLTLVQLQQQGIVVEAHPGRPEALAFVSGMSSGMSGTPPVPMVEIASASDSLESATARAVTEALRAAGFENAPPGAPPGILVMVADEYLTRACADRAFAALQAGRACFLVKPGGLRPFIGPYFTGAPDEPCPHCLAHALREQHPVERMVERSREQRPWPAAPAASLPASVAVAANLAAIELHRIAAHRDPRSMAARLWTLDLPRFELAEHRVRHRPQCPACGDPTLQATLGERPVELTATPIGYRADGGFRRESPAQSYARVRHLVSPILGPVNFLHPMPGRHHEARPVFAAGYFAVPRATATGNVFDRNCAGKGRTGEQARMSALAEAIERYSGLCHGDEARCHQTFADLGAAAVHPDELHLFSRAQIASGTGPEALAPTTPIAWTPVWSLTNHRRRWVPLAYCYTEAPEHLGARFCRTSSNGSAAGSCLEEAIFQGLLELLERDAIAIWWYGRVRRPAVLVPPSAAADVDAHRAAYAASGWSLAMLDLTHDLGCPVVTAVARHPPSDRFALGFGCHPDPSLAVRRALSELDQVFDPHATVASPWDGMSASTLDHLQPDPSAPATPPAPEIASQDLKHHIETWVARLQRAGLDTLVVNKTRPDLGLHVAQVIVPGLRHAWPRFGPGRLYTVAPALGWTSRPLTERELNPHHLLI